MPEIGSLYDPISWLGDTDVAADLIARVNVDSKARLIAQVASFEPLNPVKAFANRHWRPASTMINV